MTFTKLPLDEAYKIIAKYDKDYRIENDIQYDRTKYLFNLACLKGDVEAARSLASIMPKSLLDALIPEDLFHISIYGQKEDKTIAPASIVKFFIETIDDQVKREAKIHQDNDYLFGFSIYLSRWDENYNELTKYLIELTPDPIKRNSMIHANGDIAYLDATKSKNFEALQLIFDYIPDINLRFKMISANDYEALKNAINYGNKEIIQLLIDNLSSSIKLENILFDNPDILKKWSSDSNEALKLIIDNISEGERKQEIIKIIIGEYHWHKDNIKFLEFLIESVKPDIAYEEFYNNLLTEINFIEAIEKGDFNQAKIALSKIDSEDKRENIIHNFGFEDFILMAIDKHDGKLIEFLLEVTPDINKQKYMFYQALYYTVYKENSEKFQFVYNYIPDEIKLEVIHLYDNALFYDFLHFGHQAIKLSLEHVQDANMREEMLHGKGEKAFLTTVHNKDLTTMQFLFEITPDPIKREKMLHINDNEAFKIAQKKGYYDIINYLEMMDSCEKGMSVLESIALSGLITLAAVVGGYALYSGALPFIGGAYTEHSHYE